MAAAIKDDPTLLGSIDLARAALDDACERDTVGEHLGAVMEADRLATHYFRCASAAYPGWNWAVTVARAPRAKHVTVCESALVPGEGALLAPVWVPYVERLAPGDIGPGDVTPYLADDPLLEQGFEATGDDDVDAMAHWELGLGRPRVLSPEGRERAAQRWYDGTHGPAAPVAVKAPASCATCGFFVPMAGVLRAIFGVCANAWSPSDGTVVSLDHGCGAHSEIDMVRPEPEQTPEPIVDDFSLDLL
ncbi:MAG: DUF3027 domain-containing protein [Dermatophilaceae bacterium]